MGEKRDEEQTVTDFENRASSIRWTITKHIKDFVTIQENIYGGLRREKTQCEMVCI